MENLTKIKNFVEEKFPAYGINKKREIVRLIFEISKRENVPFQEIISEVEDTSYRQIKQWLVERRYPSLKDRKDLRLYLPEVEIYSENRFLPEKKFNFIPKDIYVEKKVEKSFLARRCRELFPEAKLTTISSLKNYLQDKEFKLSDYNQRREMIFIIEENYDFFKKCPCTRGACFCGYSIFNLGLGCIYECVYCYLQFYLKNIPGIILPANLEDFFRNFPKRFYNYQFFRKPRIGNGEFTDSLALDNLTEWSCELIEFFRKKPEIFFEFKTKSSNIDNLFKVKPQDNIVIYWSLNPQKIIDSLEFYTASLEERILSAKACGEYGYRVGFHFDPLIYYENWEEDYQNLVNILFRHIPKEKIAWVSLGTLRFNPELKKIIENRFPENTILDAELFIDFDNKLRYRTDLRIMMYRKMFAWIKRKKKDLPLYLCMENREVWEEVYGA
ncbi:MAG: radical SAM protein [Candidatus Omnitrophota bacterium]